MAILMPVLPVSKKTHAVIKKILPEAQVSHQAAKRIKTANADLIKKNQAVHITPQEVVPAEVAKRKSARHLIMLRRIK